MGNSCCRLKNDDSLIQVEIKSSKKDKKEFKEEIKPVEKKKKIEKDDEKDKEKDTLEQLRQYRIKEGNKYFSKKFYYKEVIDDQYPNEMENEYLVTFNSGGGFELKEAQICGSTGPEMVHIAYISPYYLNKCRIEKYGTYEIIEQDDQNSYKLKLKYHKIHFYGIEFDEKFESTDSMNEEAIVEIANKKIKMDGFQIGVVTLNEW